MCDARGDPIGSNGLVIFLVIIFLLNGNPVCGLNGHSLATLRILYGEDGIDQVKREHTRSIGTHRQCSVIGYGSVRNATLTANAFGIEGIRRITRKPQWGHHRDVGRYRVGARLEDAGLGHELSMPEGSWVPRIRRLAGDAQQLGGMTPDEPLVGKTGIDGIDRGLRRDRRGCILRAGCDRLVLLDASRLGNLPIE